MAEKSRQFLRRQAVERILNVLYGEKRFPERDYQPIAFKALIANNRLLQVLSAAQIQAGEKYDPLAVVGDPDDLEYYKHRASGLLSQQAWQERNLGVKLIGLTKYHERTPALLHIITDRTPAPWIKRLFGGDFEQVGFMRRNAVRALQVLDRCDPEIELALLAAADDPYFEVRVQACRAAAHFGRFLEGKPLWMEAVAKRLEDPCFEVVIAAAKAMGEIGTGKRAADLLLEMSGAHYWQVRNAALAGFKRLLERDAVDVSPDLLSRTSALILTSTDFKPHFSIKDTYRAIQELCKKKMDAPADLPAAKTAPADLATARKKS